MDGGKSLRSGEHGANFAMISRYILQGRWDDPHALRRLLTEAGLSIAAAEPKAELFRRCYHMLRSNTEQMDIYPASPMPISPAHPRSSSSAHPTGISAGFSPAGQDAASGPVWPQGFYVPGRIEVFGKHNDYAGGASMVTPVERGFCLVVCPRSDLQVWVASAQTGQQVQFPLSPDLRPTVGHWSNYPMTVARRMARNFPALQRGAHMVFASDLPPAAGMSSSSALIVAVFLALAEVNQVWSRPEFQREVHNLVDLAGYLATVENGQSFGSLAGDKGVGTFGGSEDHTAMLNCQAGYLSEYAYCPVRFLRRVRMPPGYVFALGVSGVVAEKTGAALEKYNRASGLAYKAAELWRQATGRTEPHLAAIVQSGPDAADRLRQIIRSAGLDPSETEALLKRVEQFLVENEELRPAEGDALARCDMEALGPLVDRSQKASEELLGNQVPETVRLSAIARQEGAVAACGFGAGFGGSVWALIQEKEANDFLRRWRERYLAEFPHHADRAEFFTTGAGPAAFQIVPGQP